MVKKIIVAIVIVAVIAAGLLIRNVLPEKEVYGEDNALGTLLEEDMEGSYPRTPHEVINLYCSMTREMYGSQLLGLKGEDREEKLSRLVDQIRYMYAANLIDNNLRDTQIKVAGENIKALISSKTYMTRYELSEKSDKAPLNAEELPNGVLYEDKEYGKEMYKFVVKYTMKVDREVEFSYQQLILINEDGQWKLVGFTDMQESDYEKWNGNTEE